MCHTVLACARSHFKRQIMTNSVCSSSGLGFNFFQSITHANPKWSEPTKVSASRVCCAQVQSVLTEMESESRSSLSSTGDSAALQPTQAGLLIVALTRSFTPLTSLLSLSTSICRLVKTVFSVVSCPLVVPVSVSGTTEVSVEALVREQKTDFKWCNQVLH